MANAAERSGLSEHQDGPEHVDPQPVEADSTGAGPSVGEALGQRDPAFISRQLSAMTRYANYFSPVVRGQEHLPATGPALVVGNHSMLFYMPDAWIVGLELIRRRGLGQPTYALGYDLLFNMPVVGRFLRRIGAIPAEDQVAQRALAEGAAVVVYPGGDREASRPWTQRDKVDLGGHRGFVRLALKTGVPVVPVVTHGSHDAIVIVTRGERMAKMLGLDRLRIKVFPIFLTPLGLSTILTPPLPMPSAITMEFLPAFDWSAHGPEAADDDTVVTACYEAITSAMQAALDRMHAEESHPVLQGWSHLIRPRRRRLEVPTV